MKPALLLSLLTACPPTEKDDGVDAPPINQGDSGDVDCEGTPPVIEELLIGNGGFEDFDGDVVPTVQLSVDTSDADGDLHVMHVVAWWDQVEDGEVDTSGVGSEGAPLQFEEQECTTVRGTYRFKLGVNGSQFAYDTLYEFAAVAYDAHATASEPAIAAGYTPTEAGEDGG